MTDSIRMYDLKPSVATALFAKLHHVAKKRGLSSYDVRAIIGKRYAASTKEYLSTEQFDDLTKYIESLPVTQQEVKHQEIAQ